MRKRGRSPIDPRVRRPGHELSHRQRHLTFRRREFAIEKRVVRSIQRKRVALPPRIFRIMLAHSLALTSEDKRGERRSEVGVLDEAG